MNCRGHGRGSMWLVVFLARDFTPQWHGKPKKWWVLVCHPQMKLMWELECEDRWGQTLGMKDCGSFFDVEVYFQRLCRSAQCNRWCCDSSPRNHCISRVWCPHPQWPQFHICPILELVQLHSGNALGTWKCSGSFCKSTRNQHITFTFGLWLSEEHIITGYYMQFIN